MKVWTMAVVRVAHDSRNDPRSDKPSPPLTGPARGARKNIRMKKKQISVNERQAFSAIGRIGGMSTLKTCGKKHFKRIGKKGAAARWKKT